MASCEWPNRLLTGLLRGWLTLHLWDEVLNRLCSEIAENEDWGPASALLLRR